MNTTYREWFYNQNTELTAEVRRSKRKQKKTNNIVSVVIGLIVFIATIVLLSKNGLIQYWWAALVGAIVIGLVLPIALKRKTEKWHELNARAMKLVTDTVRASYLLAMNEKIGFGKDFGLRLHKAIERKIEWINEYGMLEIDIVFDFLTSEEEK